MRMPLSLLALSLQKRETMESIPNITVEQGATYFLQHPSQDLSLDQGRPEAQALDIEPLKPSDCPELPGQTHPELPFFAEPL